MATRTVQVPGARTIALAQGHREVVLQKDGAGCVHGRAEGSLKNCDDIVQLSSRTEILVVLARLFHPDVASLVALHANVVGKPAGQMRRINNAAVDASGQRTRSPTFSDVQLAWTVTIFTTDRQLCKRRLLV